MTKEEAEVTLKVNSEQARKEFEALENKATQLRAKFADAYRKGDTRGIKEINDELNKVNREMNRMRLNAANIRAAMKRLDEATPKEIQSTIKLINQELGSGRIKRGSKEWQYYTEQLKLAHAELKKVQAEMRETEGFFSRANRKVNDWATSIAAGAAAFAGVTLAGKAAVQTYADMEAEEANVRKYTGMTQEEVASLNEEFKKMDTRTARAELNRLAQEAGRLGKTSKEDVLGFVKASDQINVALDELGDGATLELSKLTNIFGDEKRLGTEKALLSVGSVINELSQNCTAGASYLVDYAQRMAGVGAQAHLTIPQIMSYAAVLDSQGQNVEAAATAMSQLIMKMYQDPAKIAKAAGMDVKEFSEILKKDANEALLTLLKTLGSYGGIEKIASIFDEMGTDGARATAAIAALAGNVDMLVWEQGEANKAFREATSVTKEYEVQNTTVQAEIDKARKKFTEMAVTLGEKLLPAMTYCISGTSMLMRVMNVLFDFFASHAKTIGVLTVAMGSYWVALKAAAAWQTIYNTTMAAGTSIGKGFYATECLLSAGLALLNRNTTRATAAWKLFNTAIKVSPIGLAVSAIATGITVLSSWIHKNREAAAEERRMASERKKRMEDFKKDLTSVGAAAAENASRQTQKLKALYDAATNEYKATKKREEAAKALQATFPNTFSNLSLEKIMTGEAADEYLRLAKNIKEVAKAEAARDKIQANYKTQLDLEMENEDLADSLQEKERQMEALEKRISGLRSAAKGSYGKSAELKAAKAAHAELITEISEIDELMAENRDKMKLVDKANDKLQKIVDKAVKPIEAPEKPQEFADFKGESERERKAREKAERERKKREREETAEEKRLLKEHLETVSAARHKEDALNLAAYTSGQKNYLEYTKAKAAIGEKYIADSLKVLEEHGKKDSDKYAKLLEQREKLQKESSDRVRKASLFDVEQDHKGNEDKIVYDFYDPNGTLFQNQKALNQRLLDEDVRYLTAKRNLYSEGSDEWIKLNARIEDRIARDKLDKQRETAEAMKHFKATYTNEMAYLAMKEELRILDLLHQQGLIKEKEYQKARAGIMKDFRDRNAGESFKKLDEIFTKATELLGGKYSSLNESFTKYIGELSSEDAEKLFQGFEMGFDNFFGRTAIEGLDAFMNGFEAMKDGVAGNWEGLIGNLGAIAQNAANIIGGINAQFSAYWDATRDIEIAKIEERYDKEIEAAGNNTKKVQRLEEERDKEIAKTKNKYNDRAMKMEIAQAIAQTAANALGAYGAMVKIPVVGPALAAAAAAMATAAGMIQVATIRKQHQAEAAGYYSGGFTKRDPDNRKEVGVVHVNEFVANHKAVANPALSPILGLIDHAQRTNTVGSITADDVSNALGKTTGVSARGGEPAPAVRDKAIAESIAALSVVSAENRAVIEKLSRQIEEGIEAHVALDGEFGLHRQYVRFNKLLNNPKR